MKITSGILAAAGVAAAASAALAWNAHGHRTVTYLAMDGFAPQAPMWIDGARGRVAYQSNECDRWRGTRTKAIGHENKPDHFIDVELLWPMDMTLEGLPRFRYVYVARMAGARAQDPSIAGDYDPERDFDRSHEYPGFLPYAIMEHYEKLRASMTHARVLEELDDPARAHQMEQARENVIHHMGMLAHFVADAAQPLHTTEHFNGWAGENPAGYTTDRSFHSYIDGGVLETHGLAYENLAEGTAFDVEVDPEDPWADTLAYIGETFRLVEPLYAMEKSGALEEDAGAAFIAERLRTAGATLAAYYRAAWEASEPTADQVEAFVKYNDFRPVPALVSGE